MTEHLEQDLRGRLRAFADEAPNSPPSLSRDVRRHVRRTRTRVFAVGVTAVALAAFAGQVVLGSDPHSSSLNPKGPEAPAALPTGPVEGTTSAFCEKNYGVTSLREVDFALSGTVRSVAIPSDPHDLLAVTFSIDEWYRGGDSESVVVQMPYPAGEGNSADFLSVYNEGYQLLVSGEIQGGRLMSWSCGFTRYFDSSTANLWQDTLARKNE